MDELVKKKVKLTQQNIQIHTSKDDQHKPTPKDSLQTSEDIQKVSKDR